jgi:hypothetical protein
MINTGTKVDVTPKSEDSFFEFCGVVVGYKDNDLLVRDQEDDVFQVSEDQCSVIQEDKSFTEWRGDSDGTVGMD